MRRQFLITAALLTGTALGAALWLGGGKDDRRDPAGILMPEKPDRSIMVERPLVSGPGTVLPVADPDQGVLSDQGLKDIRAFFTASNSRALLIWHAGALQLELYAPDTQAGDLLDASGLVPAVMVLLTGQALRDGTLPGLDTGIAAWVPEWAGDDRGRITVRQLLEGSSGIARPEQAPAGDALAWTLSAKLDSEPGTRFAPNGFEAQVLGLVLSRAAGVPVAELLSDRLWRPMGARPGQMMTGGTDGAAYLHCCVKATARDWLRPGLLLLEGGLAGSAQLVPTPWLDQMERPTMYARHDGWRVRLGWPFEAKNGNGAKKPFVDGDTIFLSGEDGSRLYISKGRDLVVLRLGAPVADWDESALPNLVSRAITTPPAEFRSQNGMKVGKARDLNGQVEMPPITKPPPVPKVTVEPLGPLPGEQTSPARR
ncbi:serine hydrolase [Niveispirillum sp.]|uniref:serine hydrolase domain-containing protein n=1 Tax=Niveispirillum sp. TaxID=1917217 RepID=UPI001B7218C3|nr:serine hydrolase [Niveispirillum sp.]MBP7340369.1 beta-lactamase family protein [Niveispirillum sp.]